jgi:hypothetical protein
MYSGRGTEIARAVRESTDKRQKDHTPDNQMNKGTETGRFLPAGTEM